MRKLRFCIVSRSGDRQRLNPPGSPLPTIPRIAARSADLLHSRLQKCEKARRICPSGLILLLRQAIQSRCNWERIALETLLVAANHHVEVLEFLVNVGPALLQFLNLL